MPRTVIYDLKGGFGSLKKINALYEIEDASTDHASSSSLWGGPTVVQRQDPIQPSAYQQSLDAGLEPARPTTDSVRYWSDFSRVFYHPRSVVQLNDYELHSSIAPFESWDAGGELFAGLDRDQDIADRDLRPFAEEADQMQAIQVFTTLDDAWGGFASRYVERLRDEYGKTPVWVWGLQSGWQGVNRVSDVPLPYRTKCATTKSIDETMLTLANLACSRRNASSGWSTRPSPSQSSTSRPRWSYPSPYHRHCPRASAASCPSTPRRSGTPQPSSPRQSSPLPSRRVCATPPTGKPWATWPIASTSTADRRSRACR